MEIDEETLKDFIEESDENLEMLDKSLLELEKDPDQQEHIETVFRTVHTLKGGARLLYFNHIEKTTHTAEEFLDSVREKEVPLDGPCMDLLFKINDSLRGMVEHVSQHGRDLDSPDEKLIAMIKSGPIKEEEEDASKWADDTQESPAPEPPEGEPEIEGDTAAVLAAVSSKEKGTSSVRIDTDKLESLMNLVGELVLSRNQLIQLLQNHNDTAVQSTVSSLSLITTELQEEIVQTRMQPVSNILNRFYRPVRDLAKDLNKEVRLILIGEETELDRTLIEAIKDPLMHIIRNCVDHGIEDPQTRTDAGKNSTGEIVIKSYNEGGKVIIDIIDDGGGLKRDAILKRALEKKLVREGEIAQMDDDAVASLVFHPGFSTAAEVSNISGRGVGMDVVKSNIQKINGNVQIHSVEGKGTTIRLQIPLTLAIIPALNIKVRGSLFSIPQMYLQEVIIINDESQIENFEETEVYRLRGNLLPLARLQELLGYHGESPHPLYIVVLKMANRAFGLIVDDILDTEEIVVRPLSNHFKEIPMFAGSTILGSGEISLILDVAGIAGKIHLNSSGEEKIDSVIYRTKTANTALLFHLGGRERFGVQLSQVLRIEEINMANIKVSDRLEVMPYRGGILPLIRLSKVMDVDPEDSREGMASVIVFKVKGREVGLLINEVIDAVELEGELNTEVMEHDIVLGTMVIQKQLILLIDAVRMVEVGFHQWFGRQLEDGEVEQEKPKLMYIDDSPFYLKVVGRYLKDEGFDIHTVDNPDDFFNKADQMKFDLFIVDLEMPVMTGPELIKKVRGMPGIDETPILVLTALTSGDDRAEVEKLSIQGYLVKLNKEELIEKIEELLNVSPVSL